MPDMEEIVTVLNKIGIQEKKIDRVRTAAQKVDLSTPDKLYFFLNLADVNDVKEIASAVIGAYGEQGRKFMEKKVEEDSNSQHMGTKNKQNFQQEVNGMEIDQVYNRMMKAMEIQNMKNMMGQNNGGNGGKTTKDYPTAKRPVFENGKMVVDENGNPVQEEVPYDPSNGNNNNDMMQMVFNMMMKMMDNKTNQSGEKDQMMTEMFKVVASQALNNDNDQMVELQKEIVNTKEEVAEKEQQMRQKKIEDVMNMMSQELQEVKEKADTDPLSEVKKFQQKAEAMKDMGMVGSDNRSPEEIQWEREKRKMENEKELRKNTMKTFENAVETVGKPISAAIGQGVKQGMMNKGSKPNDEEVNRMVDKVKEQKKHMGNSPPEQKSQQPTDDIPNIPEVDSNMGQKNKSDVEVL